MSSRRQVDALLKQAWLQLLPRTGVGWMALLAGEVPTVTSVPYVRGFGEVVFRTDYRSSLAVGALEQVLTLGVHTVEPATGVPWYVTVTGRSHLVGDLIVNPDLQDVDWPSDDPLCIAIPFERVAARRLDGGTSPVRRRHADQASARLVA